MATVNLGRIKPVFKGAYNNSTAYVVDDIVTSGGSSYICIQASSGNAVSSATYWTQMAAGGTDVGTTLTTQGDILYRDGSGLQRLGAGTSGQALLTGGAGANPSWGTISSGTYSVHAFDQYTYINGITKSSQGDYHDIAGGNAVSFQPTSTNDLIFFTYYNSTQQAQSDSGLGVYLMMKENSSSIGSGDTKLDWSGQHTFYQASTTSNYIGISKSFILRCTGLNTSSTYYVEQAGSTHSNNATDFNRTNNGGGSGDYRGHFVQLIHYKKN